uniref:Glycosyl transferase 64 domain-containing protein n=1 Tax=Physcomitrium patens TaxID=3218 RepID=A0A7I4DU57_PHYPA
MMHLQTNKWVNKTSAWPIANPIFTCASVTSMTRPSNFVADPFMFIKGSKMYLFFETKNSITMQGDIGVAESSDEGLTWRYLGIALDEEWHLSYPYVFEYEGELYMMPEGSRNGDLRLYKATGFPLQWDFHKTLIHQPLVDASMVKYSGHYWLFASNFNRFNSRKNGQLEIWVAPSPLGPWKEHTKNPIKNGPSSEGARNGGGPFVHDGKLYRLGQDCGGTYGRRLRVFHVVTLTKNSYREVEVSLNLEQSKKGRHAWNGKRSHHMNLHQLPSGEWIAVVDGDRVPSGYLSMQYALGGAALLLLLSMSVIVGLVTGYGRCFLPPLSIMLNGSKRSIETLLPCVVRPQLTTRLYRAVSRLNRTGSSLRKKLPSNSYLQYVSGLVCLVLSVCAVCVVVNSFFGRNGAQDPYPVDGHYSQFTMIAMTYDARLWNLQLYVKHYSRCASVREIVVVWNKGIPPDPVLDFDSAVPIRIRVEPENSLNNRFKPDPLIATKAVLELDDDIMMTCDDIERGFRAWRENPDRMVGYCPRLIEGNPLQYRNERYARSQSGYNMILTSAAFMDSGFAFSKYWNERAAKGRAVVDELFNCEDILMNFILANQTSERAVEYVHPAWAVDTSKISTSAISRDTQGHYAKRTQCLSRFSEIFRGASLKKWDFLSRQDQWDN